MDMVKDHPVSGIGFGNYERMTHEYFDREKPTFLHRAHAHNSYLHVLIETGPAGLLSFLWIWIAMIALCIHTLRKKDGVSPFGKAFTRGALAAVIMMIIGSLFQDPFFNGEVAFMLWFILAGVARLGYTPPTENNVDENAPAKIRPEGAH